MRAWAPAIAYAALIVVASSLPASSMPQYQALWSLDKVMHFCAYAGLGFLVARAWWVGPVRPRPWVAFGIAVVMAGAFGALDEVYQSLTPGRFSDAKDAIADACGAATGAAALTMLRMRYRRRRDGNHS